MDNPKPDIYIKKEIYLDKCYSPAFLIQYFSLKT
jgi:hypothetical protein